MKTSVARNDHRHVTFEGKIKTRTRNLVKELSGFNLTELRAEISRRLREKRAKKRDERLLREARLKTYLSLKNEFEKG